jgi:predicted AAA+ superfamily ATPase
MFYITGSNRLLLDKNVKESLAGRSSLHILHGFSVKEIFNHNPDVLLKDILYRGGFPDLYVRTELSVERYLNNYILSFIEKDIAQSAGINKLNEFHTVLRLLAARAGQFLQVAEVSKAAGVDKKTIDSWIYCLERNYIVKLVPTYSTNLSKRVVKMKKLFFYDTGLCARLQGFNNLESLWNSPSAGGLFESLVFSEIMKTEANFLKNWSLYTWRTKEKKEVDFILEHGEKVYLIEAKLAVHGARPFSLDSEIKKVFSKNFHKVVVTSGGKSENLGDKTRSVPISKLGSFLIEG